MADRLNEKIYAVVRQVPPGRVTTYGTVAKIVGGCTARMVGYAMAATPHGFGYGSAIQRQLLEEEGIVFDLSGKIDLKKYGWPDPPVQADPLQDRLFPD